MSLHEGNSYTLNFPEESSYQLYPFLYWLFVLKQMAYLRKKNHLN